MKETKKTARDRVTTLCDGLTRAPEKVRDAGKTVARAVFEATISPKAERMQSVDFLSGAALGMAYAVEMIELRHPWLSKRMQETYRGIEMCAGGLLASGRSIWEESPEGKAALAREREKSKRDGIDLGELLAPLFGGKEEIKKAKKKK